jgi:hypothetical protein
VTEQPQKGPTQKGPSFTGTLARRALAPIVTAAATAATGYLLRKAAEIWEQQLQPKIESKGGGRAVVHDTLETAADKVGGPVSEQPGPEAEKPNDGGAEKDTNREQERRRREQRRKQRRKALEQTGSS